MLKDGRKDMSENSQFTKGEWKVDKLDVISDAPNRVFPHTFIASVCPTVEDKTDIAKEADANLFLIAAAPDLLEACERLLKAINTEENWRESGYEEFAIKAIAKAKGEG